MLLYSLAWLLVLAACAPWWLLKMATSGKYRDGLSERLGQVPERLLAARDARPAIWVHAVSVGETIAATGLVRELQARAPEYRVVVSTTTKTGQRLARDRFGAANVFYYPLDFAWPVRRYLRALKPGLFVLMETEFWPRMLAECRSAAIPVAVVNARISDRSYPRYLRLRSLWRRILSGLALVLAQSEEDESRLRAIGVSADRVRLGGNLKYDVRIGEPAAMTAVIRQRLPAAAKLIVCGSTLAGEEEVLLRSWAGLIEAVPELRMVLAPRHPERFAAVAQLLECSGVQWVRRSEWTKYPQPIDAGSVLLLDSIGELASVYSLATVAFVGGSLVAGGGHNPLEPAQFAVPIVMGPSYENFRAMVEKLRSKDAIRIVEEGGLGPAIRSFLQDEAAAKATGERALAVFASEAGATSRAVDALLPLLRGAAV